MRSSLFWGQAHSPPHTTLFPWSLKLYPHACVGCVQMTSEKSTDQFPPWHPRKVSNRFQPRSIAVFRTISRQGHHFHGGPLEGWTHRGGGIGRESVVWGRGPTRLKKRPRGEAERPLALLNLTPHILGTYERRNKSVSN